MQTVLQNEKSKFVPPNVVKKNYERELYSMGSLEAHIKDLGGKILGLTANHRHWKIVVKFPN
jgi:hypothetical protein